MKIFIVSVVFTFCFFSIQAQDEGFFKKENLITGGTLNAGFGDNFTNLGASPYFGYSFNKYIDVAASLSYNYTSFRDYFYIGDKLRQSIYGPGAFVRVYPVKFLFAQAHYEYNFLRTKYLPVGSANELYKFDAHSFLIGGGISNGRDWDVQQKTYFYFSILWDVGNAIRSPYKDNLGRSVPIIRAGYNFALFQ
jgi:hypothetical protein